MKDDLIRNPMGPLPEAGKLGMRGVGQKKGALDPVDREFGSAEAALLKKKAEIRPEVTIGIGTLGLNDQPIPEADGLARVLTRSEGIIQSITQVGQRELLPPQGDQDDNEGEAHEDR